MASKKCYVCKKAYNESDMTKVFKHHICPNCLNNYLKSDTYWREKLVDMVWGLYKDKPSIYQLDSQIDDLHNTYKFTYQGMAFALNYYLESNKWDESYLLYQAFPKVYYEARDMYNKRKKIRGSLPQSIEPPKQIQSKANLKNFKPPLPL